MSLGFCWAIVGVGRREISRQDEDEGTKEGIGQLVVPYINREKDLPVASYHSHPQAMHDR